MGNPSPHPQRAVKILGPEILGNRMPQAGKKKFPPPKPVYYLPFQVHTFQPTPQQEPYGFFPSPIPNWGLLFPVPVSIDPGQIPPNYAHTWAIDVRCTEPTDAEPEATDTFTLGFEELQLDEGEHGDVLTILDSSGHVLKAQGGGDAIYRSLVELVSKPFICSITDHDTPPYKRLYLILETSEKITERRFVLSCLVTDKRPPTTAEVRLLEDDVNYDTNDPFVDARDAAGNPMVPPLFPPWSSLPYRDKPLRSDGWYLLGKNVTDPTFKFFALVYYNEYESKLRAFLYNIDLPDATICRVQFSLFCRVQGTNTPLQGAFFPFGPNPKDWDHVFCVVPSWPMNSWIMVETSILYPMGSNFPLHTTPLDKGKYSSLYEDRFEDNQKNVLLEIEVRPYLEGTVTGDIVGVAIGKAIEEVGEKSTGDILKAVFNGIKTGVDWYKEAKGLSEAIIKNLPDIATSLGLGATEAAALAAMGASSLAGPLGVAAAAVSLIVGLVFSKDPLQLAIRLGIKAELSGSVLTGLTPESWSFFLPGRCSIKEALNPSEGFGTYSRLKTDAILPRYDRPLGLFGYRSDPSQIEFPIYKIEGLNHFSQRQMYSGEVVPGGMAMFINLPPPGLNQCERRILSIGKLELGEAEKYTVQTNISWHEFPGEEYSRYSMCWLPLMREPQYQMLEPHSIKLRPCDTFLLPVLPVIYNPFARIEPVVTDPVGEIRESAKNLSRMYYKVFFEEITFDILGGWPQTGHDQSRGFELVVMDPCLPGTYRMPGSSNITHGPSSDLVHVRSIVWRAPAHLPTPNTFLDPLLGVLGIDIEERYHPVFDIVYMVYESIGKEKTTDQSGEQERTSDHWLHPDYDYQNLSPIHDVICYWDVVYRVTDREGTSIGYKTANLSSPTSIVLTRSLLHMPGCSDLPDSSGPNTSSPPMLFEVFVYDTYTYPKTTSMLLRAEQAGS